MKIETLQIETGASADHHGNLLTDLENRILARPDVLDLRIGGESSMAASVAACYCALIAKHLSLGGEVVTSAVTSLAGPAALVWLFGSIRRVAPGAYILFSSTHTANPEPEHTIAGGPGGFRGHLSGPEAMSYSRLLRCAEPYVNIEDVLDQTLFDERLRELLLVGPILPNGRSKRPSPSSNVRAPNRWIYPPDPPPSQLLP